MGDCIEKIGFASKYDSVGELIAKEVTPLVTTLDELSRATYNYAQSALAVANVNVTKTHQIKELLDLVYDIRRLSDEVFVVTEQRTRIALDAIESGIYDVKNIVTTAEEAVKEIKDCVAETSTKTTNTTGETKVIEEIQVIDNTEPC